MRDRRNTNLSTSSTGSTQSPPTTDTRTSLNEKRYSSPAPTDGLLPLPVTKENKPKCLSRRALAVRAVFAFCALFLFTRCFMYGPSTQWSPRVLDNPSAPDAASQLESGDDLPDHPTALIVSAPGGYQRWTVSIPTNATFPLPASQYQDICTQAEVLSSGLAASSKVARVKGWRRKGAYSAKDASYLEVADAQRMGVLPKSQNAPNQTTCASSLTFAMETNDASFGKTLLMLWMSYGLAKKEGRAFFIDDSRWQYGKYTSYFKAPPAPDCVRPPPSQIVPCPHSAHHIVVSAATAQWTFGPSFDKEYAPSRKHGLAKSRNIFDLVHTGYQDLFHLIGEDATYASNRIAELQSSRAVSGHPVVGMQIRRGDLHPFEYEFSRDYLPLDQYTSAARSLLPRLGSKPAADGTKESRQQTLLLASDDPSLVSTSEISYAASPLVVANAQDRILLATKAALDRSSPAEPLREPGSAYVKHIDENAGWDGGFYSSLFYNLGSSNTRDGSQAQDALSEQTIRMRELVGRGYLLDLAVMGQSEGVVCAVSSAGCRILAVMMGWEAVEGERWVNVDDGRAWSWDGRRW